jgi:hypothetical protein
VLGALTCGLEEGGDGQSRDYQRKRLSGRVGDGSGQRLPNKLEKLFSRESLLPELLGMPSSQIGFLRKHVLWFVEEERQNGR